MAKPLRKPPANHVSKRRPSKHFEEVETSSPSLMQESMATLLAVFATFIALALYSYVSEHIAGLADSKIFQVPSSAEGNLMGYVGHVVAHVLVSLLGWCAFVIVIWGFLLSRAIWVLGWPIRTSSSLSVTVTVCASLTMAATCAIIASVLFGYEGGGLIGSHLAYRMVRYVNEAGTLLLAAPILLSSLGLVTGLGTKAIVSSARRGATGSIVVGTSGAISGVRIIFAGLMFPVRAVVSIGQGLLAILLFFPRLFLLSRASATTPVIEAKTEKTARKRREPLVLGKSKNNDVFVLGDEEEELDDEEDEYDDEDEEEDEEYELGPDPLIQRRDILATEPEKSKWALSAKKTKAANDKKTLRQIEPKRDYQLPGTSLLVASEQTSANAPADAELIQNCRRLEAALQSFRIAGRVVKVEPGPVVTLYQFEPGSGMKVGRVISLSDDLALALKVASVRVYAPVPGMGTVGIEVPNEHREIVRLRDVLESEEFQSEQNALSLALGKDTYGIPFVTDLVKMPHLLIAGATGTGKSVCINSLLMSLIFRNTPDEMRLLLIDPKQLELSVYEEIPHLYAPVVTNAHRARGVLWWAVQEMERRYTLMKALGVRDISMYNRAVQNSAQNEETKEKKSGIKRKNAVIELEEKDVIATGSENTGLERSYSPGISISPSGEVDLSTLTTLPRIVIVVDELADLMLTVGREIEELLTRLAQKARASGIHLIVATQRPSVNVITGLIKANFPARISFKVVSKIDARTVMDTSGAEKLLGQGDFLFMSPGAGRVRRLHSPFVSDKEVHDAVEWLRGQGAPQYDEAIQKMIVRFEETENPGLPGMEGGDAEYDTLYDQAVRLVVDKGAASTSMVQRAFRIGYNRAARILETMERDGIVGPADGAKPRQVLLSGAEE